MMNDEVREQLSALLDDEIDEMERPLLLGRLQRDPQLREYMSRYQLIGEVMRGAGRVETLGLAGRVQKALAEDPPGVAVSDAGQDTPTAAPWWRPLAGFAVAASVALVAVFSVTSVQDEATPSAPTVAASGPAAVPGVAAVSGAGGNEVVRVSDEQWKRIEPVIDKRLTGYLVNHNEYAASRGMQGVMPYVRIVGYENEQE